MATRAAGDIAGAVRTWLDGLDDDQRNRATFPFDASERFVWAYTPEPPRAGLAIGEMRPEQQTAAGAIVTASSSARTAREIGSIVALETVLGELEREAGRQDWQRRDPGRYWFAVFGEPGPTEPWSWRVGGHHVAVHMTVADGEVIGTTPSFLGANPAVVPRGPLAGTRTLPGEEGLARGLLATLTDAERGAAVVADTAPADILTGIGRHADVRTVPVGVRHADLGAPGQAALERLLRHYVERARPDVADAAWDRIAAAGLGDVTFAWSGPETTGHGHYYAVRGPSFVIEYDNTQDGANHVHAVWRELANDWGEDLLARHLAAPHETGG
jgi:plasmid stabilization system protein ParE